MLGLKLNHVSKRGHREQGVKIWNLYNDNQFLCLWYTSFTFMVHGSCVYDKTLFHYFSCRLVIKVKLHWRNWRDILILGAESKCHGRFHLHKKIHVGRDKKLEQEVSKFSFNLEGKHVINLNFTDTEMSWCWQSCCHWLYRKLVLPVTTNLSTVWLIHFSVQNNPDDAGLWYFLWCYLEQTINKCSRD